MHHGVPLSVLLLLLPLRVSAGALPTATEPLPKTVTRAEAAMVLLLSRAPLLPQIENVGKFPDVPPGAWFETYVLAAERFGILTADASTSALHPNEAITRAQFLKMMTLTFGLSESLPFSYFDVAGFDWFAPYAGIAESYDLFPKDKHKSYLQPDAPVTHAEAVYAIQRMLSTADQHMRAHEQARARDQQHQKLQLYLMISTQKQKEFLAHAMRSQGTPLEEVAAETITDTKAHIRLQVFTLVNLERKHRGIPPLNSSTSLEHSSQEYAMQMAREGFFSHVAPDGSTLKDRIRAVQYYDAEFSEECNCIKGFALGENLARGQKTPKEVVAAWMNSRSHRNAILNPDYTDTGIGISSGIWVQHFGGHLEPEDMTREHTTGGEAIDAPEMAEE